MLETLFLAAAVLMLCGILVAVRRRRAKVVVPSAENQIPGAQPKVVSALAEMHLPSPLTPLDPEPEIETSAKAEATFRSVYDIFMSYARLDNQPIPVTYPKGWVTAIRDHILADQASVSREPLRIFFDIEEIRTADDWRHRILGALRQSKILLVCFSPAYFASEYCRWEWDEYLRRQVHQLMGSDSTVTVYFIEVPGSDEQENARWLGEILRGNYTDLKPWFPEGPAALRRSEVRLRMDALGQTLWHRIDRARNAQAAPGNLRRRNPHFLGRHEELRLLHEQLVTGSVGVVTAVHGLGGQGKTELAVAYAHGFTDYYPAGLWLIGVEGDSALLPAIARLAFVSRFADDPLFPFQATEAQKNDPVELGHAVLLHLSKRGGAALLLLDNVSDPALLSPAQLATLPSADWLRIVATTRLDFKAIKNNLALVAVDSLDDATALELIRDFQPLRDASGAVVTDPDLSVPKGIPIFTSPGEAAALAIVKALGGFTLAVEQIAIYLGLHPEVTPSSFLATLQTCGLGVADTLPQRDGDVAAQMLTQSKQLGLILEATLAKLDAPARTALSFAALLPPDTVPWPWLRELTVAQHPALGKKDDLGADPWLTLQRRLTGLRLLTPGDAPEITRLHRLVGEHLRQPGAAAPLSGRLDAFLGRRAAYVTDNQAAPVEWELDALRLTLPFRVTETTADSLATSAVFLTDKILTYRTLPAAALFLAAVHGVLETRAASDPANAGWQRDRVVSLNKLGDLAVAQGDLAGALRSFTESKTIRERLAASDPANAGWQRDLSVSFEKLGDFAKAQGDLAEALRSFTESKTIRERLAASDPANAGWQRDLSVSLNKLGDLAVEQGDLAGALRSYTESKTIRERLAASDPANAEWQRDLSISYEKLADHCEKSKQPLEAMGWWKKAHDTLAGMKQRGLHLTPEDEGFLEQLRAKVGEK